MEFNKILVPVAGTEADDEALTLACQLAKKNKAKIWAVYVITVKRALPLDADIEAEIKSLRAKGAEVLEIPPSQNLGQKRAFVKRQSTKGVLIEMMQDEIMT